MAVNKVVYAGETLVDLTSDTVTPDSLAEGVTAHNKSGAKITGTNTYDSDTQDATAAVAEILSGKTAYVRGAKITGTMKNNGAVNGSISTKAGVYTVPQGYHDGSGKVQIASTEQAKLIPENIRDGVTILGVGGTMSGFTPPATRVLDPDEVYRTTRPADWLPLPTPGDDELYLLCHLRDGTAGVFTAKITYSGTCKVEFGHVSNGAFVAQQQIAPVSGTRFYHTLNADNYSDLTLEGDKQIVVRISGNVSLCDFSLDNEALRHDICWIVDAVIGVDSIEIFFGSSNLKERAQSRLRYVRFVGNGSQVYAAGAYGYCADLKAAKIEMSSKRFTLYASYMFLETKSLIALSDGMLVDGRDYIFTFSGCALSALPQKKFKPTNVSNMFNGANLICVDGDFIDTSNVQNFTNFVYYSNVREVLNLDISHATALSNAFAYAYLTRLTFAGETTPGGWTISLTTTKLNHNALVEMIDSLPTATAAATINISGNPGAAELTDDEIAVATAKNWTITR